MNVLFEYALSTRNSEYFTGSYQPAGKVLHPEGEQRSERYSWAVLTSATLVALSMNVTLFSPGPVLNSIRQGLHTSFAEIAHIFTFHAIIPAVFSLFGDVLAD